MGIYFIVAIRNLLQAKRRSLLLSLALSTVAFFLILLLGLSQGMTDTMIRSATILFAGHVNIGGFNKAKLSDAFPMIGPIDEIRTIVAENSEGLDYLVDRSRGWAKLISETSSLYAAPTGIDITQEQELLRQIRLAEEREYKEGGRAEVFGDFGELVEPNSMVLFAGQAKRLGVVVGDQLTLSAETAGGRTNTLDVRIVAIAKDIGFMSNWGGFLPKQTISEMYQTADTYSGVVMVYLKDPTRAPAVMEHLRGVLEAKGFRLMDHQPQPFWMKFETVAGEDWTGQKLDLTTWEDEVGLMQWAIAALDSISIFLIAILLVIVMIGIVNTMFMAVRERTYEIGTLRAIGMQRRQVLRMFLLEVSLLGAVATATGALLGAAVAAALNAARIELGVEALRAILMSDTLVLSVRPGQIVATVIAFTLVTAIAAMWPAIKAARLQPVTAIHHID